MSKADEILKKVQDVFKTSEKEITLSEVITADGLTIFFDGELEVGSSVWTVVDGENVALPIGEYLLPDGSKLVVDEVGIIAQLMPKQEEVREDIVTEEEPMAEPTTLSKEDVSNMIKEALEPLLTELSKLSEVEKENAELKTELSNDAASDGISTSPEGKSDSNIIGVSLSAKKTEIGINRVYETLYGNN